MVVSIRELPFFYKYVKDRLRDYQSGNRSSGQDPSDQQDSKTNQSTWGSDSHQDKKSESNALGGDVQYRRAKRVFNDSTDCLNGKCVPTLLLIGILAVEVLLSIEYRETSSSSSSWGSSDTGWGKSSGDWNHGSGGGGSAPFDKRRTIWCLKSSDLPPDEWDFAIDYCQSKNHYYVEPEESIPWQNFKRVERQLGYYHWVYLILVIQSLCFYLPGWLWYFLSKRGVGNEFDYLISEAHFQAQKPLWDESRQMNFFFLSKRIWSLFFLVGSSDPFVNRPHRRIIGCPMGRRGSGISLAVFYLFYKLMTLLNAVGQFLFLNALFGAEFRYWGWEVLVKMLEGENWQDSRLFPRLTLCDVPIRRVGQIVRNTIQCQLRANAYLEKLFFFVWWLFCYVLLASVLNFLFYLFQFAAFRWSRVATVRHLVRQREFRHLIDSNMERDVRTVQRFAEQLAHDGVSPNPCRSNCSTRNYWEFVFNVHRYSTSREQQMGGMGEGGNRRPTSFSSH